AGIEAADSIVIDPHKGLFLPYGTGVLLVRDERTLRSAFAADAAYLQDVDDDRRLPDYAALGPELTRDFRGLRLWLPLRLHGVGAFRAALDEKLDLARMAYDALSGDPQLETPWQPDLSTVVFRPRGDDAQTERLLARINAAGPIFLASTQIDGRRMIRFCVLSHRTHAEHVAEAIAIIGRAAREI
ncbi:MAG TPA: pyridoxal-dependent decarboxylase, partial [Thermomicrobiales bacterium]|nr:pyridoxal-dependent decarboxylase [Thermomicrobiales bacterium]